jgi:parallel beta-helix repeat protein
MRRFCKPSLEQLETRDTPSAFVYKVINTDGNVNTPGSLPWAVFQANYVTHGENLIEFKIPGPGVHVIQISQTLYFNTQILLDGSSQPGYAGTPLISIQGNASLGSLIILQNDPSQNVNSSWSIIQGVDLYDYGTNAITIFNGSHHDWIQHNWIGFYNGSLETALGNNPYPCCVGIQSSSNFVRYNTLSGQYNAVNMGEDPAKVWSGTIYKRNHIEFNTIDGNTSDGIFLGAGADWNYLGPNNLLMGNFYNGIDILDSYSFGNQIFQNDITGNGLGVLLANGASRNVVGGALGGNIISDNYYGGISLGTAGFPDAAQNFILDNYIGDGPKQNVGVSIQLGSTENVVGNNVIFGSAQNGIVLSQATGNTVESNNILSSTDFGVAFLPGASYNTVVGNVFAGNLLGSYYIDANAVANYIV